MLLCVYSNLSVAILWLLLAFRHSSRSRWTTSVNVKQIITAWLHPDIIPNHAPTLSPSSSHTWQTYLSHRPFFHLNSNWHLSHLCWKKQVYRNRISQISDRYPIWIGKILERLAFLRFFPHISKYPSFSPLLSAYREFHSTETALLKLTNDIMETIDSGRNIILTALDVSAVFDTLDHTTLLHRLQHTFGLSSYVISSYLTDRSSFVKIDSSFSRSTTILTGVPQGSVLGPLLFVLFISPVANVINSDQLNQTNIVSFHQYADDTQLYIVTNSSVLTT